VVGGAVASHMVSLTNGRQRFIDGGEGGGVWRVWLHSGTESVPVSLHSSMTYAGCATNWQPLKWNWIRLSKVIFFAIM